jgi:hypothetical protein
MATVLEQQGGRDSSIPRVHVHGGPLLCGSQEDFSETAILKPAGPGRIPDATVLEIEHLVLAPVWEMLSLRHAAS